jgi:VanZ family protein
MSLDRLWWSLGVLLVGLAVIVCLLPSRDLPTAFEWNDKVSHVVGHAAMAAYFAALVPRRGWWKIFVFLLMLGISIEFAQYFMGQGRKADVRDVLANATGAAVGLICARLGLYRWTEWAAWLLGRRAAQ